MVDEILIKNIQMEQLQNYLLDLLDTKTERKEIAQIRQAVSMQKDWRAYKSG